MSTNTTLRCIEVVEIVTDYLERALSPAETRRLEEHLELCPGCLAYVAQMRQTIAVLGRLDRPAAPAAFDDLLVAFRERHAGA
jgi:anti-sigma factor RsiW